MAPTTANATANTSHAEASTPGSARGSNVVLTRVSMNVQGSSLMPRELANETCSACVFDASRWTNHDAVRTVGHAADLMLYGTEGLDASLWNKRPDDETWSIAEYVDHLAGVFEQVRAGCELAVAEPERTIEPPSEPVFEADVAEHDRAAVVDALAAEARQAGRFFESLSEPDWENGIIVGDVRWTSAHAVRHLCHDLMHHLMDIADIRALLGDSVPTMRGEVAALHLSDGGVPKLPVAEAMIDASGLVGDTQANRRHHGRPFQALCLYSAEVIQALRSEGHPIEPGSAGENITISGLDWAALRAGLVLEIGGIRCRLSAPATPCAQNHQWFSGTTSQRISHERHPGWSRWYASVLEGGSLKPGDPVRV